MRAALLALLALPLTSGCITETVGKTGASATSDRFQTRGVIVREPIDSVWGRMDAAFRSMATGAPRSNGVERSLRGEIRGAETTLLVEPYDAQRTIVHVNSDDERVEAQLQSLALQGPGR